MTAQKDHDLYEFMRQIGVEMASEYNRIQMRATEDPGTAGDQGEENWAALLRDWLPRQYEVVTKGRIISADGRTSPQVDVLVLTDSYPQKLLNKKLFLAAGVAAAFECKTTLKKSHAAEAVEACAKVKDLYRHRRGTPYKELHAPIIYGLLAHSHSWKAQSSTPEEHIEKALHESDAQHVSHPRSQLDFLCVADLATWVSSAIAFIGPNQRHWSSQLSEAYGPAGSAVTSYMGHVGSEKQVKQFTPIGVLISYLIGKLAWESPSLRALADYYRIAHLAGSGRGRMRTWPSSIYSADIRPRIEACQLSNGNPWDEWGLTFV